MLTDFFVGNAEDVQLMDIAKSPSAEFQCLRAKRVDPVKIVQLQCCIEGASFNERVKLLDEMLVRDADKAVLGFFVCRKSWKLSWLRSAKPIAIDLVELG